MIEKWIVHKVTRLAVAYFSFLTTSGVSKTPEMCIKYSIFYVVHLLVYLLHDGNCISTCEHVDIEILVSFPRIFCFQ